MFIDEEKIITGIKKGITIINWINLFFFICNANNAEIKVKRTKVGAENKKISKILIVDENSIPNKSPVKGIRKKFEIIIDESIDKLLAIKICSGEKPRNWSSLRQPFLKSSSTKCSDVKISENKIIMNKIGRYIEDSIFKLGPTEKANNKKTSKKKLE